ncbi:MAG: CHASE domain-containing protein [Gammaproteobacteria bacterium]|nr:CHASE domain-containing protein [Gammaproteobacteria bacterium]
MPELQQQRRRLERAGRLHVVHWLVLALSLCVTFAAWWTSKSQHDAKVEARFEREAGQVVDLVVDRMRKYEDALWAGTSLIDTFGGAVSFPQWLEYATSLKLERKYPGVNGIGVIHMVQPEQLDRYLREQRAERSDYSIHPPHQRGHFLPISYIVPVTENRAAVGLDIAHEDNRYTAALKARDTRSAQITGPIVLVQDAERTPGFLFYAPFFSTRSYASHGSSEKVFAGMVYAPFVFKKLMRGVLDREKRLVGISVHDDGDPLYNEHTEAEPDFDPDPMFKRRISVPIYGRTWAFDVWSSKAFRAAEHSALPLTILVGGLIIDALLLYLFLSVSSTNRMALRYADQMNAALLDKTRALARSNEELEQFAYAASHDLQEPLRMVSAFTDLLRQRYQGQLDEKAQQYIGFAADGARRMQVLLKELLDYARVDRANQRFERVDCRTLLTAIEHDMHQTFKQRGAELEVGELPEVWGNPALLQLLFQNLVSNGLKFNESPHPRISIMASRSERGVEFRVIDNGIGIAPEYREKIFTIFERLHDEGSYPGTGIGLAICKKIVSRHSGSIEVQSALGGGTTFKVVLPAPPPGSEPAMDLSIRQQEQGRDANEQPPNRAAGLAAVETS